MNKRASRRKRVLKAGTIEFGGSAITCMLPNMSDIGAMLDVVTPVGIPDHFTLVLRANKHRMPCRVVWRKEKRIGVVFN
jgi:PilZ domain-containing protein